MPRETQAGERCQPILKNGASERRGCLPRVREAKGQSPKFHPALPGSQAWRSFQDPALMTCLAQSWGQGANRLKQEQGIGAGGGTWTRSSRPDPPVCETPFPPQHLRCSGCAWGFWVKATDFIPPQQSAGTGASRSSSQQPCGSGTASPFGWDLPLSLL